MFDEVKVAAASVANWLTPALLLIVVSWVGAWLMLAQAPIQHQLSEISDKAIQQQIQKGHLSKEQAEKAREMEGGGIHGAGNVRQGQVFGKARGQQQTGPLRLLPMSLGGGGTAWLGPEATWVINAPNDRRQKVHSQLVDG